MFLKKTVKLPPSKLSFYEGVFSLTVSSLQFTQPIKRQCCPPIETSQWICTANQLTGSYMKVTLALNGLNLKSFFPVYHIGSSPLICTG